MTPQAERLLRYFAYQHLQEPMRSVSHSFYVLAHEIARIEARDGAEQTTALRKLLEAKDCAVRAMLPDAKEE
jgi:hypothetical protein